MQVISGYLDVSKRSTLLEFRLYHMNRPAVRQWRKNCYKLDVADRLVISMAKNQRVVAVDCAGWYLNQFGITVQCVESNDISKLYFPYCSVEPDLMIHRPTYINDDIVLFKFPHFLRYCAIQELVNFLELWCKDSMVLNFDPNYVKYNRLKYKLIDLIKNLTDLNITETNKNLWVIKNENCY